MAHRLLLLALLLACDDPKPSGDSEPAEDAGGDTAIATEDTAPTTDTEPAGTDSDTPPVDTGTSRTTDTAPERLCEGGGDPEVARINHSTVGQYIRQGEGVDVDWYKLTFPEGSTSTWWSSDQSGTVAWREFYEAVRAEANAVDPATLPEASANSAAADPTPISGGADGLWSWEQDFSSTWFIGEASIEGFLNLRHDYGASRLWIEPRPALLNSGCEVALTWAFTSETAISDVAVTLEGERTGESELILEWSPDGEAWDEVNAGEGAFSLGLKGAGKSEVFYVRIRAWVPKGVEDIAAHAIGLDRLSVSAGVAAPEDTTVTLDPGGEWTEDFATEAYQIEAALTGESYIQWTPGQVSMGSIMPPTTRCGSPTRKARSWAETTPAATTAASTPAPSRPPRRPSGPRPSRSPG